MHESTRHRLAFEVYFRLGPRRSLEELHGELIRNPERLGAERAPSRSSLDRWSSAFHWQERLLDLERQARQADAEQHQQVLEDMNQRHIKEGVALQQKGFERLHQLAAEDMPVSDAIRAVLEGVKLERLARGEPTEHIRQEGVTLHGQADLAAFTAEELRRMVELAERGTRRTRPAGP